MIPFEIGANENKKLIPKTASQGKNGHKDYLSEREISSIWFYMTKQQNIGIPVASWLTRLTNDGINFHVCTYQKTQSSLNEQAIDTMHNISLEKNRSSKNKTDRAIAKTSKDAIANINGKKKMPKIKKTCWGDHGKKWLRLFKSWNVLSTYQANFILSVFLSFALLVENVWLINISIPFRFLHLLIFFSRSFSLRNWQKCIHSCVLGFISLHRECVIALFQINTFHAIYLLTWDGVFRQTISWYVVIYRVLSACMSLFFWTFSPLKPSILDIYLYQIGTGPANTRWNILQQIKSI